MKKVSGNPEMPAREQRRPGRPGPQSMDKDQMRDRILNVSEQLFSESGCSATSFRDIARLAQVNPALIGYYFGSKRALFNEVYKRRGRELTDLWVRRLDELEMKSRMPPSVEQLLRAFLEPQFELKASSSGGMAFVRLQTRVHSQVDDESFALRREVYDREAKRFISLLERALPNLEPAVVNSRFIFCIGAVLYMIADVDRLSDLSGGRFDSKNVDMIVERLVDFCVGGMSTNQSLNAKKTSQKGSKPRKSRPRISSARLASVRR